MSKEKILTSKVDFFYHDEMQLWVYNNNSDWPYLAGLPDGIPGLLVYTGAHKGDQFCPRICCFVVVAAHMLMQLFSKPANTPTGRPVIR